MKIEPIDTDTIQVRRWSRQEYDQMIEAGVFHPEERAELIDGEILSMTPQRSGHMIAIQLAEAILRDVFGPGYNLRVQGPLALDPSSEPEPDIAVVVGAPRDYRDAHPCTAVLVVEVADTSLDYDRKRKGSLYARAGIADYWLVNLIDRSLEVHRNPAPDPQARYGWQCRDIKHYTAAQEVSPLGAPQARIAVQDLLP